MKFIIDEDLSPRVARYLCQEFCFDADPEIAGDKQLFVYIFTFLSVTDALEKFDEFDERWWLDRIDRANGLLNFNLRFV